MEKERTFSEFGSDITPEYTRRRKAKKVFLVLLFVAGILLPFAFFGWSDLYNRFLEQQPPQIRLPESAEGIGLKPREIPIVLEDQQSGIDAVIVQSNQAGQIKEILRKEFRGDSTTREELVLVIDGQEEGLLEGDLTLQVIAFDRSFFSNRRLAQIYLTVDYSMPEMNVITTQHNAVHGGAQLVFFRITDGGRRFQGLSAVKIGSFLFPGFPAKSLDESFSDDIHFTFFPVPLEVDPDEDKVSLYARDSVGNTNASSMFYRVRQSRHPEKTINLKPELWRQRVEELYQKFQEREYEKATTSDEIIDRYRTLQAEYRDAVEFSLQGLFSSPKLTRFWQGSFARPIAGATLYRFGEQISYTYLKQDVGTFQSRGTFFRAPKGKQVRAANDGIVIFADTLGIYGKTVIIDHGFGLMTLYGHLDSLEVSEGNSPSYGDIIGVAGDTGLTDRSGLIFEVRLHGVPVRPEEWWDKNWVKEHIDARINTVKRGLGINVSRSLARRGISE